MERFSDGITAHATESSLNAAANAPCISRSEATHLSQYLVRAPTLCDEGRERRNVGVPLDERGQRAEAVHRVSIQLPDRIADLRPMVVDEHVANTSVAGKMNFADAIDRKSVDEGLRIEAEIPRTHVHVIDVEQQ